MTEQTKKTPWEILTTAYSHGLDEEAAADFLTLQGYNIRLSTIQEQYKEWDENNGIPSPDDEE